MIKYLFPLIGIAFIVAFFFTDPTAKTDDGYSLRYFFLIMGIFFAGLPFFLGAIVSSIRKRRQQKKVYFMQNGIKAIATVIDAERTGVLVNHLPQYNFHLKIVATDGRQFETTDKKVVDFMDMNRLRPGATIPSFIDPKNEKDFFICWEEATYKEPA